MLKSFSIRATFCVFVLCVHPSFRHLSRSSFTWWTCVWNALTSTRMWFSYSSPTIATGNGPRRLRWFWWWPPWAKPWEWPRQLAAQVTQMLWSDLCSATFPIQPARAWDPRKLQRSSRATPWLGWCWRICPRRGWWYFHDFPWFPLVFGIWNWDI